MRRLRRAGLVLAMVLFAVVSIVGGVGCALSAPTWKGPTSDHFDGKRFVTPNAPPRPSFTDLDGLGAFVRWQSERKPGEWPAFRQEVTGARPPYDVTDGGMRVTFINHATTLIQVDGVNVLTDPIYAERASPFDFVGPARVRPPGIAFKELPRIDAVVLSHNHYDHMDVATLQRIADTWPAVQIFAGLGNKAFLDGKKLPHVTELDWWETRQVGAVTIRSVPNQHFSNRGLFDSDGTLWSAWVIEGHAGRAYFAGDTAYGPHFTLARQKLGPMRVAVLPIGAYKPEWFMSPVHMSPAEAVTAAAELEAGVSVPMHYGTFNLADDGEVEPVDALRAALDGGTTRFAILGFGEALEVP